MRELAALLFGYLLGSVLPADLIARARGVDIRAIGTRNPGSTNAFHELGTAAGLAAGAFDMAKGLAAMYLAYRLGLAEGWIYLAGLAAVVGHVLPVFAGFRGGQGMAASTGMLLWGMGTSILRGWVTPIGLLVLAIVALGVYGYTRNASMVGAVAVPVLAVEVLAGRPDIAFGAFMLTLASVIWVVQVSMVRQAWRHARCFPRET